jgi:hypothetical protein
MLARLTDLEPEFLRWEESEAGHPDIKPPGGEFGDPRRHTVMHEVADIAEAQGVWFICPVCRDHQVMVGFRDRGLLDHQSSRNREGKPSRWGVGGTGFSDLTLDPSIDCGCGKWHGWIRNGEVT